MSSTPHADDPGALGVLGVTPGQEELYRLLLRNSGNSVADLAASCASGCRCSPAPAWWTCTRTP